MAARVNMDVPRPEYPRPNMVRPGWLNLNGTWDFEFDEHDAGTAAKWFLPSKKDFSKKITVPFCFQSRLSGVGNTDDFKIDHVWYKRDIHVPDDQRCKRAILRFGAVDFKSTVYVNGVAVKENTGGSVPFHVDITDYLDDRKGTVVVRVEDMNTDGEQPRGKQIWTEKRHGIWYDRVTGIWQTPWLEFLNAKRHVEHALVFTAIKPDKITVSCKLLVEGSMAGLEKVKAIVRARGSELATTTVDVQYDQYKGNEINLSIDLPRGPAGPRLWSLDDPFLHELHVELLNGKANIVDAFTSTFGIREVTSKSKKVLLNGEPVYQKLLLDQGYWPDGLWTAPTDQAFIDDIRLSKEMGFNGVRKHQKIEDPRWLHHCDQEGFLVWGEFPNSQAFSFNATTYFFDEWRRAILRDYNHPSIITWTPLNEAWGVPNAPANKACRDYMKAIYFYTKMLDPTRLISTNDGWWHVKTDLVTFHVYAENSFLKDVYVVEEPDEETRTELGQIAATIIDMDGDIKNDKDLPFIMSECGGWGLVIDEGEKKAGWGYGKLLDGPRQLLDNYEGLVEELKRRPWISGFVYTELTDVFQERNGFLTFDRQPKISLEKVKAINERL